LGKIGSPYAIINVSACETECDAKQYTPYRFRFGESDPQDPLHNTWWQKHLPLAVCRDSEAYWAVFPSRFSGVDGMWLTSTHDSVWWEMPELLSTEMPVFSRTGLQEFTLRKCGRTVTFVSRDPHLLKVDKFEQTYDLGALRNDADSDGLPDLWELLYGTSPGNPDSDGDGVNDSKDRNPLTSSKNKPTRSASDIRQTVFYYLFGFQDSFDPIYLVGDGLFTEQEYRGYRGFVLQSDKENICGLNIMRLNVQVDSNATATAEVEIHNNVSDPPFRCQFVNDCKFGLHYQYDRWFINSFTMSPKVVDYIDGKQRNKGMVHTVR
jgi:hypothetical protein